ncbi:papain family cysteine protease [Peptostreptococcaceae bacterium oral taxon 113 str. W5053]|nr:papain family cysteine protease [Peptostreptococcaceae bacterium oral taxon 113 str. W5053]
MKVFFRQRRFMKGDKAGEPLTTGWLPPLPDMRDYSNEHPVISKLSMKLGINGLNKTEIESSLPGRVDLREWCSPVEDQLSLGSCTANAVVGMVEYFQKRAYGTHIEGSRLFVYKTARKLMLSTGDSGAWLRSAMGALVLFGVPDEKYFPYTLDGESVNPGWDSEPDAFLYSLATHYAAINYFCHDPMGKKTSKKDVLRNVKTYLAAGIPSVFGFFGFPSFESSDDPGSIPYPCKSEQAEWGHAVMAVGYDDDKVILNTKSNEETKGALMIRNSWGRTWGQEGYGWLPYDYILYGLAEDFWSILSMEWIDTEQFGLSL